MILLVIVCTMVLSHTIVQKYETYIKLKRKKQIELLYQLHHEDCEAQVESLLNTLNIITE
jgi:hypothetical protein